MLIVPFLAGNVTAQTEENTSESRPVLANTPSTNGTDMTVATGAVLSSIGVGAAALIKDRIDKKSVTKNIKATDVDFANYIALNNKLHQYAYVYKNYTYAQLLDLPATSNPMDKTTIGQALTNEANNWLNYVQTEYGVPRPPMSIASQSIVTATQGNTEPPKTQTKEVVATKQPPTT